MAVKSNCSLYKNTNNSANAEFTHFGVVNNTYMNWKEIWLVKEGSKPLEK